MEKHVYLCHLSSVCMGLYITASCTAEPHCVLANRTGLVQVTHGSQYLSLLQAQHHFPPLHRHKICQGATRQLHMQYPAHVTPSRPSNLLGFQQCLSRVSSKHNTWASIYLFILGFSRLGTRFHRSGFWANSSSRSKLVCQGHQSCLLQSHILMPSICWTGVAWTG